MYKKLNDNIYKIEDIGEMIETEETDKDGKPIIVHNPLYIKENSWPVNEFIPNLEYDIAEAKKVMDAAIERYNALLKLKNDFEKDIAEEVK